MVASTWLDVGVWAGLAAIITISLFCDYPDGDAAQFIYLVSMMILFVGAVVVMGLMGMWLNRRPRTQPLAQRWLVGLGWFVLSTAIGYGIILIGINK